MITVDSLSFLDIGHILLKNIHFLYFCLYRTIGINIFSALSYKLIDTIKNKTYLNILKEKIN